MNKHEQAIKYLQFGMENGFTYEKLKGVTKLLKEAEATEKAYEELKRNVKRYRELDMAHSYLTPEEHLEYLKLDVKLSKVGNENE
jgi:hypothetical protein